MISGCEPAASEVWRKSRHRGRQASRSQGGAPSKNLTVPDRRAGPGADRGNGRREGHRLAKDARVGDEVTVVVALAWPTVCEKCRRDAALEVGVADIVGGDIRVRADCQRRRREGPDAGACKRSRCRATCSPSKKVTVPVGVPAPGATAVTVAVNVTDWPDGARVGRGRWSRWRCLPGPPSARSPARRWPEVGVAAEAGRDIGVRSDGERGGRERPNAGLDRRARCQANVPPSKNMTVPVGVPVAGRRLPHRRRERHRLAEHARVEPMRSRSSWLLAWLTVCGSPAMCCNRSWRRHCNRSNLVCFPTASGGRKVQTPGLVSVPLPSEVRRRRR